MRIERIALVYVTALAACAGADSLGPATSAYQASVGGVGDREDDDEGDEEPGAAGDEREDGEHDPDTGTGAPPSDDEPPASC